MTARVIAIVGAGASNLKSTVAANLAVALAAADVPVALADADGASSAALAVARDGRSDAIRLPWLPRAVRLADAAHARDDEICIVDPPARFGPATDAAIAAADLVLVPLDASPLALRVLGEIAASLAEGASRPVLRTALARRLPREADRWALVDDVERLAPGALLHSTLPMSRTARSPARQAVLFAPGTAASRAYARLAHELVGAPLPDQQVFMK